MASHIFDILLKELGQQPLIPIKTLHPDKNNSCLIALPNGIQIQLEMDRREEFVIIGCDLGPVPKGKYRENLFREALKTHALPPPRYGAFGFHESKETLLLFDRLLAKDLNGEKLAGFLAPFIAKAGVWKEALARSEIPVGSGAVSGGGGMFGLR